MRPHFSSEGAYTPDALIFNTDGLRTGEVSIPSGTLSRGAIVTETGGPMATGTDGYGVLAEDVDASGGAVVAVVYLAGEFNENALVFGGADRATAEADLRTKGIFIRKAQEA